MQPMSAGLPAQIDSLRLRLRQAQIPLGSSRLDMTRLDTFGVSSRVET